MLALSVALLATNCSLPERQAAEAAIRAARRRSNDAIARHDADAAAAEMAVDARVLTSGNTLMPDRNAMRDAFALAFADPHFIAFVRTPDDVQVDGRCSVAAERGHWSSAWTPEARERIAQGTYAARWGYRDGRWVIESELFVPLGAKRIGKGD